MEGVASGPAYQGPPHRSCQNVSAREEIPDSPQPVDVCDYVNSLELSLPTTGSICTSRVGPPSPVTVNETHRAGQ